MLGLCLSELKAKHKKIVSLVIGFCYNYSVAPTQKSNLMHGVCGDVICPFPDRRPVQAMYKGKLSPLTWPDSALLHNRNL